MSIEINYLSVLVAAIVSMAWGFVYYSPAVVGKPWMKLMGYTEKSLKQAQKKMGPMYGISFLAAIVTAYVLAHMAFLSDFFFGYGSFTTALSSAFFAWLGFVMPVQLTGVIFEGKNTQLFLINTGFQLSSLLAMAVVIGLMA